MDPKKEPSATAGCALLSFLFSLACLGLWKLADLIHALFLHYRHGG